MAHTTPDNLQSKLLTVLTADPKKSVALGVLLAVLAVMVARFGMSSSGARTAQAAAATLKNLSGATSTGKPTDKRGAQALANPYAAAIAKWSEGPVPPVSRNLFAVRSEYFPVDGSRTTKSAGADEGFWSRLEKSITSKADLKDKRENLIANFKNQAAQLRLQSTVMGPEPRAMINGELVGEGSVVAAFRVIRIEARRVIVEREGIRLEIQMK